MRGGCFAIVIASACGSSMPSPSSSQPAEPEDPPAMPWASSAVPMSEPVEYEIATPSREAGEAIFTRTGIGDPYRTGVPYPMWLALMRAYPDQFGGNPRELAARFGFVARMPKPNSSDLDEREGLPVGMHLTIDPITGAAFVVTNCALCHAERVHWRGGDAFVVGLANKRVRIHAYDAAFAQVAREPSFTAQNLGPMADAAAAERSTPWPPLYRDALVGATVDALVVRAKGRGEFLARVHDGPPGRVATIETFALAIAQLLGRAVETAPDVGWAKIPDVIGFAKRDTLSWDGVGTGPMDVLAVEADFAAGVRPEWFLRHPQQGASLGAFLRHPGTRPAFPAAIDRSKAERGHTLFLDECAPCHGRYSPDGRVADYREQVVPLRDVETDPARVNAVTASFVDSANSIAGGITHSRATGGYVPPILTNMWARAPYGHAGQWPSIAVLATMPERRAAGYAIDPVADYDLDAIGVASAPAPAVAGLGTGGHPFLAQLDPADIVAVIEYLKTL
jgi:mono/diheme cytochrome c family protein